MPEDRSAKFVSLWPKSSGGRSTFTLESLDKNPFQSHKNRKIRVTSLRFPGAAPDGRSGKIYEP